MIDTYRHLHTDNYATMKKRKHFGDGREYAIHPYDVYNFDRSYVSGYAIANPTVYKPLQWSQNSRVLLLVVAIA